MTRIVTRKKGLKAYMKRTFIYGFIMCLLFITGTSLVYIASEVDSLRPEVQATADRRRLFAIQKRADVASELNEEHRPEIKNHSTAPSKIEVDNHSEESVKIYTPLLQEAEKTNNSLLINGKELQSIFAQDRNPNGGVCKKLFNGDVKTLRQSYSRMLEKQRRKITNIDYLHWTLDCDKFKASMGYFETPFTAEERDFPIAYSIVAYKRIEAVERFLRLIYRPQNYYCIHMDVKTSSSDLMTIKAIAECFPNVFLSSRSLDVKWGEFSVLEADIVCMEDLWKYPDWKYYINLTGQELPLKTNLELVNILKVMKWANLVDGTWLRARQNYFYRWTKNGRQPPHGIRPIKGSLHIAVNRDFVDFALHDYRSRDFMVWLNKTEIPDETFFSSLNHNPHLGIPGSFLGEPEEYARKPTFTRYKNWELGHGVWVSKCAGKFVRNICIMGIGDLKALKDTIGLFVNKIDLDFEYLAYECLEELIYNRTRDQYLYNEPIDTSFYQALDQVRLRLVL